MIRWLLAVALVGCDRSPPVDTTTFVPPIPPGTTPTGPTTPTVPTEPAPGWTAGPALPACTPVAGDPDRVALSGVVLLPTGAEAGLVVIDRATDTIACAGAACDADGATVVCTDGVISPALINAHDHAQYNVLAPWRHAGSYGDRYDWQSDGDYWDYREAYDEIAYSLECETVKWAELRMIVSGATAVAGSTGDACIETLARNLDEEESAHGLSGYALEASSGQVWWLDELDADERNAELAAGTTDVFLEHVAEGIDGRVRAEIDHLFELGLVGPGNGMIHATDATVAQLAQMAATSTGIVWSPRSNLDLYDDTTLADVALRLGVPVVLGPDWTWSGSNRVSAELACAHDWLTARSASVTDVDLWEMVTLDAAVLLGLQGRLGMLVPGAEADVLVVAWSDEPWRALIEAEPDDVRLVLLDGDARYGDPALVAGLEADPTWCESVTACAETRTLCVAEASTGTDAVTYAELEATLSAALGQTVMPAGLEYASELYPLWSCDEARASCDLRSPSADDVEGDGISDDDDLCPGAFDPRQTDHDGDGLGDACDPCPLSPESSCVMALSDIDDDGIGNDIDGCPWLHDPGNPDTDDDGHPDACDACPTSSNPGDAGCPTTIRALRDPNHPEHPAEGVLVTISGVVTAAGPDGLFVQDPAEADFGAVYVYGTGAAVGDEVQVEGDYDEYFGLTEIASASVTVTGSAPVPPPISVPACDIATFGVDAERYESMLVEVSGASVTDANPDAPSDYDEFEVDGCLRVDDAVCPDCWLDQPLVGTDYARLTGVLTWSYGDSKLLPRTSADLVP